jgi:hypothetical protein
MNNALTSRTSKVFATLAIIGTAAAVLFDIFNTVVKISNQMSSCACDWIQRIRIKQPQNVRRGGKIFRHIIAGRESLLDICGTSRKE